MCDKPTEEELIAVLQEAAKVLGVPREVPDDVWEGMRERQQLMRRSLRSNTRMSGPL
jgi:hypothetical protein